ncbi:MFS transporter [Ideonella livida]|uniref:MFS transporter n=1 Tax=Ideonella livida TaxID=2707176 RepID=A0A7C9PHH9_9BURK|nr:MFS transporter [Ideonella livida]NDY91869.1 MFS transporter [Ideonella livida]
MAGHPMIDGRRRTLAFTVVLIAFVMDLLDVTIVNVALPAMGQALAAGPAQVAWTVAGYALAFAVLLIVGGRLGDLYGHRTMFLWGVGSFTLASLACGLAPTAPALVAARLAQGACAALMVPQVLTLMQALYAPHERMRAFTLFGLLGGVSAALGPVVGGLLLDADPLGLGWRVVFLINLPVGGLAMVGALRLLPPDPPQPGTSLDLAGTGWCLLAACAWAVPLVQGPEQGWSLPLLALLASAPGWTWALWRHCQRLAARGGQPIVQPALLQDRGYRLGLGLSLLCTGVVPAHLFVLTLAWQMGAGLSATQMALLCLPIALGVMASVSWLGRLAFARLGARCIFWGLLLQTLGVGLMAAVAAGMLGAPVAAVQGLPGWLSQALLGLGVGFIGPPLTAVTLQSVPRAQAGGASGAVNAGRQFAAVAAIALVAALLPHGGAPALGPHSLLLALPGLAGLLGVSLVLAWRMPALSPAPAPVSGGEAPAAH